MSDLSVDPENIMDSVLDRDYYRKRKSPCNTWGLLAAALLLTLLVIFLYLGVDRYTSWQSSVPREFVPQSTSHERTIIPRSL